MEEYIKKYKKMIFIRKVFVGSYFTIMALAFLGGLVGIIVCGARNQDSFLSAFIMLCLVVPVVMLVIYLILAMTGKDKKREALDCELENSDFSAEEIMQIGEAVKIDLFYVAVKVRAKELGLEHVPEGCIRDRILP